MVSLHWLTVQSPVQLHGNRFTVVEDSNCTLLPQQFGVVHFNSVFASLFFIQRHKANHPIISIQYGDRLCFFFILTANAKSFSRTYLGFDHKKQMFTWAGDMEALKESCRQDLDIEPLKVLDNGNRSTSLKAK